MRLYTAYDRGHIINNDEFISDASRIVLVSRLLSKWVELKESNLRLMVNHIIIINNIFGETGLYTLYEYVSNFRECIPALLTTLYFMGTIDKPAYLDSDLLLALNNLENER
jgi:hypothetical protein